MGQSWDDAQSDWDAAGRPSLEELEAQMDPQERDHTIVVDRQAEFPEHDKCTTGLRDPDYGVVCGCGTILGDPDGAPPMPDPVLPASVTSEAAAGADPLAVQSTLTRVQTETGLTSSVDPADPILAELQIIDPTRPYDSRMVEEHLLEAVARLERGAHYERICAEDYAQRVLAYEKAYARAVLKAESKGAADIRKAYAQVDCEQPYMERMIAKMKLDAIQGTMHSLRSVVSAYQSVAKSVASTYSAGGSNGRQGN